MIGSLRGRVLHVDSSIALLEVAGIGYRLHGTSGLLAGLRVHEEAFVYTHDLVREDARELYAFSTIEDLRLFERIIGVSGVGPKIGLAILSIGSGDTVKRAIMNGDLGALTSISGVGTKIAQKIILELKGQLVDADAPAGPDGEVISALVSLGYSTSQAKEAVKHISADTTDVSDRIREALRNITS